MTDQPANDAAPETPQPLKPCCGNCRFAIPVPKDFLKIDCHWGPPTSSMVALPGKGGQIVIQQMCAYPQLPRNYHCFRHERKLDS